MRSDQSTASEPEYVARVREHVPVLQNATRAQVEFALLNTLNRERITGCTAHEHRRACMQELWPHRHWNPWRETMVESFYRCEMEGKKELSWLGCYNSGKSSTKAELALQLWWENPVATSIFLAAPYKDAADTGLWAYVRERFFEAKAEHPWLLGELRESEFAIELGRDHPRAFIKVATIDEVAKLQGKKLRVANYGRLLVLTDELPLFPNCGDALLRVLGNLRSVRGFMLIGSGNFKDTTDAMGRICEPMPPLTYDTITEEHEEWTTARCGLAIRFDAEKSPNVVAGYEVYPGIATSEMISDTIATYGKDSPDYMMWVKSLPLRSLEGKRITTMWKLRSSGALDEQFEWTAESFIKGAHCDPSEGGDAAVFLQWRLGWMNIGEGQRRQVFEAFEPRIIPISLKRDETPEEQIVQFCKEQCDEQEIPYSNFSFDGSLRANIVQEFMRGMSSEVQAFDYQGAATDRWMDATHTKRWKEEVSNLNTELWFAVGSAILSGQIRGLFRSTQIQSQLTRRKWDWHGDKRKKIETKPEYKAANSNKSPNEADALVGGVEMARRRGFVLLGTSGKNGGAMQVLRDMKRSAQARRSFAGMHRTDLPPGSLHAMKPPVRTGVLHRD